MACLIIAFNSWTTLSWCQFNQYAAETLPTAISPIFAVQLILQGLLSAVLLIFILQRNEGIKLGIYLGVIVAAMGLNASRWPLMTTALTINGGVFIGPLLKNLLAPTLALSTVLIAYLLVQKPPQHEFVVLIVAGWVLCTAVTEFSLTHWKGLGPKSLEQAAGLTKNVSTDVVLTLGPKAIELKPELSKEDLMRLEYFLKKTQYRDIFTNRALNELRQGWLRLWHTDRALDAMMINIPGKVHPDYRGALEIIKFGPKSTSRYQKLEALAETARLKTKGFEDVTQSQYIFEGFAACYAGFSDEANARQWLMRIDGLIMVSDKKIEITPLEDFQEGRVTGKMLFDGKPAINIKVGLFSISTSTSSESKPMIVASSYPNKMGNFTFNLLGPGLYEIALMGDSRLSHSQIPDKPKSFELNYDKPFINLNTINIYHLMSMPKHTLIQNRTVTTPRYLQQQKARLWHR